MFSFIKQPFSSGEDSLQQTPPPYSPALFFIILQSIILGKELLKQQIPPPLNFVLFSKISN